MSFPSTASIQNGGGFYRRVLSSTDTLFAVLVERLAIAAGAFRISGLQPL